MEVEAAQALETAADGKLFKCVVESIEGGTRKSIVQLIACDENAGDRADARLISVNEQLIAEGWALFNKRTTTPLADALKKAQAQARKLRRNAWRYGDIDGDSDDDDGADQR